MAQPPNSWMSRNWQGLLSGGIIAAFISIGGSAVIAYYQNKANAPIPEAEKQPISKTYLGQIEQKLSAGNIFLSGDSTNETKMRTYLHDDPGLRGVAETCVSVLNGRKFKEPLHLDVIYGKYKVYLGGQATRQAVDPKQSHRADFVQNALRDNWNEMYPERQTKSISQVIE